MVKPQEDKQLVSLSLQQFVKSVGARTVAPGGGSVSAAVAALVWGEKKTKHTSVKKKSSSDFCVLCVLQGAALGAMVGQMTYGKRQFENLDSVMRRLIPPFHQAMEELLLMVDADSSAFNSYMVRNIPVLGSSLVLNSNYSSCIQFFVVHSPFKLLLLVLILLQAALKMPKNSAEEIKR